MKTFEVIHFDADCGKLTNPENGEVLQSESTYGAEARYNCSLGYRLDGSQSRFCSIEGNWFGTAPKCVQISKPNSVVLQPYNR